VGALARNVGATLGAIAVLVVVLGNAVTVGEMMPENARILFDPGTSEYISPPCLESGLVMPDQAGRLIPMRVNGLRGRGAKPNTRCRDVDGFVGAEISLIRSQLERIGFPKHTSRWDEHGDWRW